MRICNDFTATDEKDSGLVDSETVKGNELVKLRKCTKDTVIHFITT